MSSASDGGADDRKTITRSLNEGLHPSNMPTDRLRQYLPGDVDDDDAARVHNPHEWAPRERSWRERLLPQSTASKIAAAAVSVFVLGLAIYFWPIIGPFFQSPITLILAGLITSYILVWLHGNQAGMRRYIDLDKWIRVEGDDAEVVPVERLDDDHEDSLPLFRTIDRLSFGGFDRSYLSRRDLPYQPSKLKRYPGDDGFEPVVDAGNHWTYTVETDTLGTFHVTDTDGLSWARGMDAADRHASNPSKLDADQWDRADRLISELFSEIQHLRDQHEMMREHIETTTDLRDELHVPEIENTVRLLKELSDVHDPDRRRRSDSSSPSLPMSAQFPPAIDRRSGSGSGSSGTGDSE